MKYVKNPNDIVDEYVRDHLQVFSDNVLSIIMYGSAVTHEFIPGKSDVNMVHVLKDNSLRTLAPLHELQKKWSKRGVAVPFYLDESYIDTSAQSYPLEFLDLKSNYRVLHGIDPLNTVEIENRDIYVQCEKELKGYSIGLRRAFLNTCSKEKELYQLAGDSIRDLIPVLKGIIVLYGETIPNSKSEIVAKVEDLMNLGASSLSEVFNIANIVKKIDIKELLFKYCDDLDNIIAVLASSIKEFTQMDL